MPSLSEFSLRAVSVYNAFLDMLAQEHWDMIKWDGDQVKIDEAKLSMCSYGSKEELIEDVKYHRIVPGSHLLFQGGQAETYTVPPFILVSLRRNKFIYKQDLYNCLYHSVFPNECHQDVEPIITFYLRTVEQSLDNNFELVRYEEDDFRKFFELMKPKLINLLNTINKVAGGMQVLKSATRKEFCVVLKKMLPRNERDPNQSSLIRVLKELDDTLTLKEYTNVFDLELRKASLTINEMENFMKYHWFSFESNPKNMKNYGLAVVRLFKDGDRRFVLARELHMELKKIDVNVESLEEKWIKLPKFAVLDFRSLFKELGKDNIQKIEFVTYPILRTTHRTNYIPTHDGEYMVPSADVIIEIIHDIIGVKKLFQDVPYKTAMVILEIVREAIGYVQNDLENCWFMTQQNMLHCKDTVIKSLEARVPEILKTKKKEPYRVDQNGFTRKNLQSELERLGYINTFPMLRDCVQNCYEAVEAANAEDALRTCDMIEALEQLQRNIFLMDDVPEFLDFFHAHGACRRFTSKCSLCTEEVFEKQKRRREQ